MDSLMLSLIIVFLGITLIPMIPKRFGIPVIVAELIFGILIGKSLFNIIPAHSIINFFSYFGLAYLMFLVGLEIDLIMIRKYISQTVLIVLFSIGIPFVTGMMLANAVNVHPLLLGTVFSTTSLGLVLPLVKEVRYHKRFLQILLGSVLVIDMVSMFLLAFSLTIIQDELGASFFYSFLVVLLLFVIPWIINKWDIRKRISTWVEKKAHFDMELRFAFALIVILATVSEELGFHSIIGAFIAGLIISELTPTPSVLEEKLEGFGYGFFIPLFFIFVGARVDIPALFSSVSTIDVLVLVLVAALASKAVGVGVIAKIRGFNLHESVAMGFFHAARLSLIIATAEIGNRTGLIGDNAFSMLVIVAIVTSLIGPFVGKFMLSLKMRKI